MYGVYSPEDTVHWSPARIFGDEIKVGFRFSYVVRLCVAVGRGLKGNCNLTPPREQFAFANFVNSSRLEPKKKNSDIVCLRTNRSSVLLPKSIASLALLRISIAARLMSKAWYVLSYLQVCLLVIQIISIKLSDHEDIHN